MGFTGEAVRQGNSTRFGVDSVGATPRAFVSFNGEPYVITRDGLIHITDLANGSGVLIQNNSGYNLSSPDPTCAFVYNARMYFLDRGGNTLQIFDDPLTGDVSLIDFFTNIGTPSGAATDGTTVWIYDASFDALHTIDPDTAATTLLGTVGFDVTTPSNNITGMFYYDGKLYLLDNGTELLFVIEDPSAATLEATAVDVNVVEFGASQRGVNGGSVHDGEAYMAGGNPDALYRFYNVRWNETIAAIEVDSGGDGSLDLSTVSSDATSFEFVPSYTAPSWLTISGNDLVITGAPDVTSDTDYSPEVRAVRGSFHEDETLTVRVSPAGAVITAPTEPTSLQFFPFEDQIVAIWQPASDNGGESPLRYDVRIDGGPWISTDLEAVYTFQGLSPETEYTIEVAQVNSAGRGAIASGMSTTDAASITVPSAPTSLSLSETHNSIVVTWAAANDNGGESPIRYDIRIDGGSWIDTGLDPMHTFSSLSAETEYTIEVAQVNSVGRGTAVSGTVTTDAAPIVIAIPGAPRSLSLSETHNSIVVTWVAAANNGGESPTRYDIRINNGNWIDTGLDLTHTFASLSAETEYTIEVVEVNSAGRGAVASASVTTDAAPVVITTPGAPRSLALTETHNSIVATWRAAANNGGESPTHYDVRIEGGGWIDAGLDLTHTFENLSAETEYTIEIAQVNSAGRGDIASESVTTDAVPVVITVPSAPRNLTADAGEDYVDLDWNAPADTGGAVVEAYKYRRREGSGTWGPWTAIGSIATQYRVTGLTPDTTYSFEVRGVNSAGDGTPSQTVNVRTDALPLILTPPSAPQNLRVTGTDPTSIDLDWNAPANNGGAVIEAYKYRQRKGSGSWRPWTAIGSTATRYTVTGLDPDAQYTFQVRAVNSEGDGTPSQTVTARTDMALPLGTPQNIEVELTSTTALLKWAAATAGGAVEEYEVSYAEGASPGTTWIPTGSTGTRFFVKGLKRGTQYTFRVRGRNSGGAGAASRAVTQKTPIASLHNALFFKECVNYFDNGGRVSEHGNASNIIRAVADNDYKTFTREKDLVLNIAVGGNPTRVDAIFVKGQDIERHSAEPTGGTGSGYSNRRMPSTVKNWEGTDVSTVVAGFQHDLYLLDSHFTATSVRVTFTGTDVKITEIMLLEFGLEIDSNADFTEIATNFVDRTGVVHPDPSGGISYTPPLGGGRDRWQIDYAVKVVPGKTLLETPEDFLYWRAKNRNHVFCMEPSRFPWRIFPAVFVGKSVPVRYRTDDKTGGEILNFRVAEQ